MGVFIRASFALFFSGLRGVLRTDFKKLVAFSTLNQLALIFLIGGLNFKYLILFHMLCHAGFKFLLFLVVGGVIFFSFNRQDSRLSYLGFCFFFSIFWLSKQFRALRAFLLCWIFF